MAYVNLDTQPATNPSAPAFPLSATVTGTYSAPFAQQHIDALETELDSRLGAIHSEFANVDTDIQNAIAAAESDATSKDAVVLSSAQADASAKASAAESNAKSYADGLKADVQAQINTIVGTSPAELDTLQEIVAAYGAADSNLQTAITNLSNSSATALSDYSTSNDARSAQMEQMIADLWTSVYGVPPA